MRNILFSFLKKTVALIGGHGIGRIWPFRQVYQFLLTRLQPRTAEVHGHKMFLDPNDSLRLSLWGVYEPFETRLFMDHVKSGDVVLDIGANIGYYTLLAAKLVGAEGSVHAFEPDPDNFALLQKNVRHNNYQNVVLENRAVSDRNGKIELFKAGDNWGGHSIYDAADRSSHITVDVIALDDFFKDGPTAINLVKMDIEGAEVGALQGMIHLFGRHESIKLFTEFSPVALKKSGSSAEEYLDLLKRLGFAFYYLNDREQKLEAATRDDILKAHGHEADPANLFCVKSG